MDIYNRVFEVTGYKILSLIIEDDALKFSSEKLHSYDDFQLSWNKKLTLATKLEVKYDKVKSIKKEVSDSQIKIKYAWGILPSEVVFAFVNDVDYEIFVNFLIKRRYFKKIEETLTSFKAIKNYLIGLLVTIGFSALCYYQAIKISKHGVEKSGNVKTRLFKQFLGFIGDKGVLVISVIIVCYLLYKIWNRYKTPPNQIKLLPPNTK